MLEVTEFLSVYNGLTYEPTLLNSIGGDWTVEGVTVIDYESAKIVALQYFSKEYSETLLYFNYQGNLSELPRATLGNVDGFLYQTYASDDMNIVCWQLSDKVMGLIIGHRSAVELATIASRTMK